MTKGRAIRLTAVVILLLVIVVAGTGIVLFRGTPSYYHAPQFTPEQRQAVANSADQKLLDLYSWAASVQARGVRQRRGPTTADDPPIGPKTIAFNQDEFNSLLDTWRNSENSHAKSLVDPYFSEERLILQDGEIILAGQSKDLGTVVSAAFEPSIDEQGQLHMELAGLSAGQLPLPASLIANRMGRLKTALRQRLTSFQQSADIDDKFTANPAAAESIATRLMLDSLNGRPSDSVICVPFDVTNIRHQLPVRVTQIKIDAGVLTATLTPLDESDPTAVLSHITTPYDSIPTPGN